MNCYEGENMWTAIIILGIFSLADVFLMWCLLRAGAMADRQNGICDMLVGDEEGNREKKQ